MRIAIVIPYNPLEEIGGLELGTVRHSAALLERGHSATIITKGQSGNCMGVPVKGFQSFSELCRHLLSDQPLFDLVHWLEIFPDPGEVESQGAVSILLRASGTSVVLMVATSGNLRSRGKGPLVTPLLQNTADAYVISNPDQILEFAESGITENIHIIGFGIDTNRTFRPVGQAEKKALRAALGLPQDKVLCLFMGRLVERKRPDFLLRSWQALAEIHNQAALVVVASGMGQHDSIEASLSQLIANTPSTVFRDITPRPEDYYRACDLLLLPSIREGQPNVLMEMMACGNPVVGSDIPGIRELLIDGVNGITFPPADKEAFRSAVARLVNSGRLRKRLGQAARQKIVSEKDIGAVTDQYLALYQQFTKRRGQCSPR